MGNSLEDWKRVPTTAGALFGIDLPYRPPKNPVGAFLWRQRFWIETTSGLSLLEPWEKILTRMSPPLPLPSPPSMQCGMLTLACIILPYPQTATRRAVAILYFLLTLVFTGLYKFVPQPAPLLYRRTLYYLFGSEGSEAAAMSVRRLVADWAGRNTSIGDL